MSEEDKRSEAGKEGERQGGRTREGKEEEEERESGGEGARTDGEKRHSTTKTKGMGEVEGTGREEGREGEVGREGRGWDGHVISFETGARIKARLRKPPDIACTICTNAR